MPFAKLPFNLWGLHTLQRTHGVLDTLLLDKVFIPKIFVVCKDALLLYCYNLIVCHTITDL